MFQLVLSPRRLIAVAAFAVAAGGCAGASGLGLPASALVVVLALVFGGAAACFDTGTSPRPVQEDATPEDTENLDASDSDLDGTWQTCCDDGEISTCFCPANAACNYGRFKRCGGNRCVSTFGSRDAGCPTDASDTTDTADTTDTTDATDTTDPTDTTDTTDTTNPTDTNRGEGRWVTCCRNGRITTCFCPAGVICNYGRFKRCGGNRCVNRFGSGDAGCPVDASDAEVSP